MRVLLLSALVATSYAGTWNADFWADYTAADTAGTQAYPVPAAITTAAIAYDTAITAGVLAVNTALDLADGADYAAAAQAHLAVVAACDTYAAVFATAGTDSAAWPGTATADLAKYEENVEDALIKSWTDDSVSFGVCNDADGNAVAELANAGTTDCEAGGTDYAFVAAQDQAAAAQTLAETSYAAGKAEWDNANGYCATTWGLTETTVGLSLAQAIVGSELTDAEVTGIVAALAELNTTVAPSTADEDSAKSPAAALAAGVAAIALLL